ncbi:MAG: protein TolQ [Sandaracinus sp.]|nr:protein TolQ [Sandaracinus sp.]
MKDVIYATLISLQAPAGGGESLDPWKLIADASFVVKLVMIVLSLMALGSWFIMGAKMVRLAQARGKSRKFLDEFWASGEGHDWTTERIEGLYATVKSYEGSPIAAVFRAGYVELARVMSSSPTTHAGDVDNVERALDRAATSEMTAIETMLPFLATTGSVAPFIGLFGTVWGIMNSFMNISQQASASLDVVAPGIAEALIATAIGLAAAIPAVIAYNFFVRRIQVLESEVHAFERDFLNIVRRHFLRG